MESARVPVAVLVLSLSLTVTAAGQVPSPTGNVYGNVVDEQGKSLPGITATLSGPGAARVATTDTKGDFHILNLSPGAYSVRLQMSGFQTVSRAVTVVIGKNAVLSVTMPVAAAAESVTVSGETPLVDSRKTGTGATYGDEELQSIPTTRDPWAILRQVPGVLIANVNVGGSGSGAQSAFVGKGSHSDQNTYNLDGVGVTESNGQTSVYFDFDALDSIGVVTGGSDPSLTTSGVTLNVVTKRGTNQLLGSARVLYAESAGWDYGVEAGGPLWKDRLWLWGAFGQGTFLGQTFILPDGEPTQSKPTITIWNAKLNAQLAAANSLVLSYVNSDKHDPGQFAAPDRSQPSTYDEVFTTSAYRVEDSHVQSANLFASLSFSYLSDTITQTPQGGLEQQALLDENFIWRNTYEFHSALRPRTQVGLTASGFFSTGDLRHELKFGFGYKTAPTDSTTVWPGDGLVGYEPLPPLGSITRAARIKWVANTYDTYLADTIQTGNFTLAVGARFDYQQGRNLPSAVPANAVYPELLPAVQYGGDSGYPVTWRQFQPRVGVTYSLGSNRKTLLRASYSEFANRMKDEVIAVNAFPGTAGLYYYWNDANGNHRVDRGELDLSQLQFPQGVDPTNPGSSAPVNQIAKSLKPPTTHEFIVGVEREILADLSAALAYTYRSAHNPEFVLPNYFPLIGTSRGSYQYVGNAMGTATASDGFVLNFNEPYYSLVSCPAPCAGGLLENRQDFTETYNGVELQLVKRLSHGWMLRASFAYNDWQQHVGPGAIINPNNMTGGTNASGPVVDPNTGVNSTWQFNVSGLVQLPLGIDVSANLFGRQGFPVLYNVQVITNDHNLFTNPNIQIGAVGAYRLPDVYLLDLHVEKVFQVGSAVTIIPVLDCFNAANSHTVLFRDGFVGRYDAGQSPAFQPNGNFNMPGELLSNRVFRGGVRVTF